MTDYVFVTVSHDYADEFEIGCCFAIEATTFEEHLKIIKDGFGQGVLEDKKLYFGTNEYLSFDSYDDFIRGVSSKPCSEEFYKEWVSLTNDIPVGFDAMDYLLDWCPEFDVSVPKYT